MAITYDDHAEFQIRRRGIDKAWIEATLADPDAVEVVGRRRSALKCLEMPAGASCNAESRHADRRSILCCDCLFRQDKTMHVRVDRAADAIYLNLTDAAILESEEVADGIVVDYDASGRIVGVEILDASKRTGDPDALAHMSFELPGAA